MIAGGAEVTALGRVVGQAARAAIPSGSGGPGDVARRSAAYSNLHRSTLLILSWVEYTTALQQSVSAPWRAGLAALTTALPAASKDNSGVVRALRAARPAFTVLLAGQVAERLDYQHAVRAELAVIRSAVAGLLTALADVRLFGGDKPIAAAENLVAVIGELLADMPVATEGFFRRPLTSSARYERARDAVGFYVRRFDTAARLDLSRWSWRRQQRTRRWQLHRPQPRIEVAGHIDVARLVEDAAEQ